MDNDISPVCRFCLGHREEFNLLATTCPALWMERHTINAQDPDHSQPELWTPQQILDFTFFPRINDAFVKPLYQLSTSAPPMDIIPSQNPDDPDNVLTSDSEASIMDVSSLSDSSSQSIDYSDISIDSNLVD